MQICPKTIIKTKNLVYCKTVKMSKMNYEIYLRFGYEEFEKGLTFFSKKFFLKKFLPLEIRILASVLIEYHTEHYTLSAHLLLNRIMYM